MAPIAGRLIGRYPDGLLGGIGLALLAVGLALLAALPAHPANADIVWRMALCGIGFGLFQSPNNHTIVTSPPPHRSGAASGMLGTARLTGQTFGAVLLAAHLQRLEPARRQGPGHRAGAGRMLRGRGGGVQHAAHTTRLKRGATASVLHVSHRS